MLRVSVDGRQGLSVAPRLETVMGESGDSGVAAGALLLNFAEAVVAGDEQSIAETRRKLGEVVGGEAVIDAAGVISNFQRMVRIADSTGIGLGRFDSLTADVRERLGIEKFK